MRGELTPAQIAGFIVGLRVKKETIGEIAAAAQVMLAGLVIRAGRGAEAIECALRAHELDRRSPLYLNTLGIAYGEAQQLDEAVRCFKRSLKELPSRADTHYNLGKTYSKLGDMKEAQRCYVRAHQLDPERGEIANNLAELYSRQGRYREALALIAEARVRTPENEVLAINSAMFLINVLCGTRETLASFIASQHSGADNRSGMQ